MTGHDPKLNPSDSPYINYINGLLTPGVVLNKPNAVINIIDDVKIHAEAWDGLKSVMVGRGGILRYVGGQVTIPALPTVIITNSKKWFDHWKSRPEWNKDTYFW